MLLAQTSIFGYYGGYYGITGVIPCPGRQEYKSFPTYSEAQVYLTIGVNHRANIFGSSGQDSEPPITSTDSDSESDTTTSTEAEPQQVVVARNNDFRDGVFFGFLLGALFILWTLRLR